MKFSEISPVAGFTVLVSFLSLLCGNAFAVSRAYEWSISASSTDAYVNVQDVPPGLPTNLYLWLGCSTREGATGLAAEFELTDQLLFLSYTPAFIITDPVPGYFPFPICVEPLTIVGTLLVLNLGAGGTATLVESSANGLNATADCDAVPQLWPNAIRGFATPGFTPDIVDDCGGTVSVEETGWGGVKSLYR
ncbi:MAG: hypothetical protein R3B81_05290 [bacterium]